MTPASSLPMIGVPACFSIREHGFGFHQAGDKYVEGVLLGARGLPVIIPAIGARLDVDELLDRLDGLLITGSPSNVEPHHYEGPPPPDNNESDPARDATTLPLIRKAIEQAVPLFAICRGIQELNVALGGSLHQEVHRVDGRFDHRSDKARPHGERYEPVHPVELTPGGMLQDLLAGASTVEVNSLHGQAIDRLAPRLTIEASAADGTIEAVTMPDAPAFVLGVQWHPEWRVLDNPVSRRLFAAFGEACQARAASRSAHARHGVLASGA